MRFTVFLSTLAAILSCLLLPCLSFNPTWGFTLYGLAGIPHEYMTHHGVTDRLKAYFDVTDITPSIDYARNEITQGSIMVDDHKERVFAEAEKPEAHCDDEHIEECHNRLSIAGSRIRFQLQSGDISGARTILGRVLHTLQDFYSHSNWIELGFTDTISQKLGRSWPLERDVNKAIPTCVNCSYPGVLPLAVQVELDFADWLRVWALNPGLNIGDNDPMSATTKGIIGIGMGLERLGVKTIRVLVRLFGGQDFPHSIAQRILALGDNLLNVLPDCKSALTGPFTKPASSFLTTGYFGANKEIHSTNKPPKKCSHGGMFDRDARGIEGISKDTSSPQMSPRHDLHYQAARLAKLATIQYLDDITTAVCDTTPPQDCVLLKALYGIGPSLTFVIDTTFSMSSVLAAVRDDAIRIVNDVRNLDITKRPSAYVLAPFNDPGVPAATSYTDADAFITAILQLEARGGGDCAELAMAGLANAVAATPAGGKVFLWTDAGAKDADRAADVARGALRKGLAVTVFQFDSGCQTPEGFDLVTLATGGSFQDGIPYDRAGATTDMAKAQILRDSVGLLSRVFSFLTGEEGLKRCDTVTVDVPVDTTVTFVGFSANSSTVTMTIVRPDGSVVQATDADVTVIDLDSGVTTTVDTPAAGVWKVTLTGTGDVALNIFGSTSLVFSKFDFVESRGSHHEGLYPVLVDPRAGDAVVGYAAIEGDCVSAAFELMSLSGTVLSKVSMTPGDGTDNAMPSNLFFGNVSIPTEGFNIYATGKDGKGAEFVRFLPGLMNISPPNGTSSAPYPYKNATSSTMMGTGYASSLPTPCPTCQPEPYSTAIASLTRTIFYHSVCPLTAGGSTEMSTSTVTAYLTVPCYSSCPTTLPVISPGCASEIPTGVKHGSSPVTPCPTCSTATRTAEAPSTYTTTAGMPTLKTTSGASDLVGKLAAAVIVGVLIV